MAKQPKGELVVVTQGFDYAPLEAQVAERVRSSAEKIRSTVQKTMEDIIVVSRELLAVKEAVGALPPGGPLGPGRGPPAGHRAGRVG